MNILLTGKYNIGKTTLLSRLMEILNHDFSGYTSFPIEKDNEITGFMMKPLDQMTEPFIIGIKDTPFSCKAYGDHFDTLGVDLLIRSLNHKDSTIIMDELGFMESDAKLFQEKVIECLDSNHLVLGILKGRRTAFLDYIRQRDDIHFFNITEKNRNECYQEILKLIGEEKNEKIYT